MKANIDIFAVQQLELSRKKVYKKGTPWGGGGFAVGCAISQVMVNSMEENR